jgi:uncharacterized membrane protein YdjX (TVP38/TMEM64 family)
MPQRQRRKRKPAWAEIIGALVFLALLGAAWRYTPLSDYITTERVGGWAKAVGGTWWAPIAVVLAYVPASFVMFPRPLLTLFTVIAFGPRLGFVYSMLGITVAAWATYYAGRAMPKPTVKRLAGDKLDQMGTKLRKHGFLAVVAWRTTPVTPFTLDGIMAGALRIKLWDYTAGTIVAMLPGVLATTIFGHQIKRWIENPDEISYWILGAIVVVFGLITWGVSRWFAKQG